MPTVSTCGTRLQALHVLGDRAAQRRGGELLGAREALVGGLQRGERAAHVARELQLLAREHQHLLDFGEHAVVGAARELAVHLLERHALLLRVGHARLELGHARLRVAQLRLRLRERALRAALALGAQLGEARRRRVDSMAAHG